MKYWKIKPRPAIPIFGELAKLLDGKTYFSFSPAIRTNGCNLTHKLPYDRSVNYGHENYIENLSVDPETHTGFADLCSYLISSSTSYDAPKSSKRQSRSATLIEPAVHALAATILLSALYKGDRIDCRKADLGLINDWRVLSTMKGGDYYPLFGCLVRWLPDKTALTAYRGAVAIIGHEQKESDEDITEDNALVIPESFDQTMPTRVVAFGHIAIEIPDMYVPRQRQLKKPKKSLLLGASGN